MKFDIERDLEINPFKLNEECVSHAGLYYKYAEACADAKAEVGQAKDNLSVVIAERSLAIRKRCSDEKIKTTESIISAMVDSDGEVVEAKDKLREVEGIFAKLQVAVNAMDTRRSELDNLVKLSVSNYYASSDTKVSDESESDSAISREIRKSMNRRN